MQIVILFLKVTLYMITKKHVPVLQCSHRRRAFHECMLQFSYNMFQSINSMNCHEGQFPETWGYAGKSIFSLLTVPSLTTDESLKQAIFYCHGNSFQLDCSSNITAPTSLLSQLLLLTFLLGVHTKCWQQTHTLQIFISNYYSSTSFLAEGIGQ